MRSLVGRWRSEVTLNVEPDGGRPPSSLDARTPQVGEQICEFADDGSYTIEVRFIRGGRGLVVFDKGEYSVVEDRLCLRLLDTRWRCANASLRAQIRVAWRFRRKKATIIDDVNKLSAAQMLWIDDDTVEIWHNESDKQVLHRIARIESRP